MTLLQKTKEIVSSSIKSVIFIDEKALENYEKKSVGYIPEQELSIILSNNFKKKGISLSVHKFRQTDLINENSLDYLFKRRDLVLLDWKLDGENGEEFSLNLLSKIVNQKHIHFCSIYTSEGNFDQIINNIITYFSGYNSEYYNNITNNLSDYRDGNESLFTQISFDDAKINRKLFNSFKDIDADLPNTINELTGITNFGEALIQINYAFSNYHKSELNNTLPTHINRINKSLNINNTIITLIPKTENSAVKILKKLHYQIYKSENCFTQLLGLDMQNAYSDNSSFIDENLLNTKIDTMMFHRKQLSNKNSDIEFNNFIKSLLLEHSQQTLNDSTLKILENSFLDRISKSKYNIKDEELATLNTFYNGSFIKNKNKINFGDIFINESKKEYYLCITPLCDCLHPSNIKNNFFFVKGVLTTNIGEVIKKGDGGFKSFIDSKTCILWTIGEYIKPFQLHISNILIIDLLINSSNILNSSLNPIPLKYIFSLKTSYAQRIANHAFAHPIRVGVDFVKKQ